MALIAIDFDGTIVEQTFPSKEFKPRRDVINKIMSLYDMGHRFVLWTCREGHHLHDALDWIHDECIEGLFESVNSEPVHVEQETRKYWHPKYRGAYYGRKINADYYIDDKAPGTIEWFLNWNGTP